MKTKFEDFTISATLKGDKEAPFISGNYNNHIITVSRNGIRRSFEYWASIAHPEMDSDSELLQAFECFLSDALAGENSFEDFCGEFGYDTDSRNAEKTWKACQRQGDKLAALYPRMNDWYELANRIRELV